MIKKTIAFLFIPFGLSHANLIEKNMDVSSTLNSYCSMVVENVDFGIWNFSSPNIGKILDIKVKCNKDTPYVLKGEDRGGSYPYQNQVGSWKYVIKMNGSKPDNPDWLAYRIHVGNIDPENYNQQNNSFFMGDTIASPYYKTKNIENIGTGDIQSNILTVVLYGNGVSGKRFISVRPDTYSDSFTTTIEY